MDLLAITKAQPTPVQEAGLVGMWVGNERKKKAFKRRARATLTERDYAKDEEQQ